MNPGEGVCAWYSSQHKCREVDKLTVTTSPPPAALLSLKVSPMGFSISTWICLAAARVTVAALRRAVRGLDARTGRVMGKVLPMNARCACENGGKILMDLMTGLTGWVSSKSCGGGATTIRGAWAAGDAREVCSCGYLRSNDGAPGLRSWQRPLRESAYSRVLPCEVSGWILRVRSP